VGRARGARARRRPREWRSAAQLRAPPPAGTQVRAAAELEAQRPTRSLRLAKSGERKLKQQQQKGQT